MGEIQYYQDKMDFFAKKDTAQDTMQLQEKQQRLKVYFFAETDFQRYEKWKKLDEKARSASHKEI